MLLVDGMLSTISPRLASKRHDMVGLHVGSRVFYTHRQSTAFQAIEAQLDKQQSYCTVVAPPPTTTTKEAESQSEANTTANTDNHPEIPVFLLERDPDLFAHILKYLTRGSLHLPPFADAAHLWRDLREEADFFQLPTLQEELLVTHTCSYQRELVGQAGVFQWLESQANLNPPVQISNESPVQARKLLQQRPPTRTLTTDSLQELSTGGSSLQILDPRRGVHPLWPGGESVVVFLTNEQIHVRPSHISLRVGHNFYHLDRDVSSALGCLECSRDGTTWTRRLKLTLLPANHKRTPRVIAAEVASHLFQMEEYTAEENEEMLLHFAEKYLRRTWKVESMTNSTDFYRYFRFLGVSADYTSLAGSGLEFFGDIHQE